MNLKSKHIVSLVMAGTLLCSGCIRGPFRSCVVGDKESATVKWSETSPWLVPFTGTAGAITDVALVPLDTVAMLGINCCWRPLFDNANFEGDAYIPAAIFHPISVITIVGPLIFVPVHIASIGFTWDYYVDLFGNQTDDKIAVLIAEKRYDEAEGIIAEGYGIPKPIETKHGIFCAAVEDEWDPFTENTREVWQKEWFDQIAAQRKADAEAKERALQAQAAPFIATLKEARTLAEWENALAELNKLDVAFDGDLNARRAQAMWREAMDAKQYDSAAEIVKGQPTLQYEGLPIAYADAVQKGFSNALIEALLTHGHLETFTDADYDAMLKQQDTTLLHHPTVQLPWTVAKTALEGTAGDLEAFVTASKGAQYDFHPVSAKGYPAVEELCDLKKSEIFLQALEQKLFIYDDVALLLLVRMGYEEEAKNLLSNATFQYKGAPFAYADAVQKGFSNALIEALLTHGHLKTFTDADYDAMLKQQDTTLLHHPTVELPWTVAQTALEGTADDLEAFVTASKGAQYDFHPVSAKGYPAVEELCDLKKSEIFLQALEQELIINDDVAILRLMQMGCVEEAKNVLSKTTIGWETVLNIVLDSRDADGMLLLEVLPPPPQALLQAKRTAFDTLCTQQDDASKHRVEKLQAQKWVTTDVVKAARRRVFEHASAQILRVYTAVTIERNAPQNDTEKALLEKFPEFKDEYSKQKDAVFKKLRENRPLDEICQIIVSGHEAIGLEMFHSNPAFTTTSADQLKEGIQTGNFALFELLMTRCKKLNGPYGQVTPLMTAVKANQPKMVHELLKHKVNVNRTSSGISALDIAVEVGNAEIVKALLDAGSRYENNSRTNTPLAIACKNGFADCAILLLEAGADANVVVGRDWGTRIPIVDCAIATTDSQELVRMLVERGALVTSDAVEAALQKDWIELSDWLEGKRTNHLPLLH